MAASSIKKGSEKTESVGHEKRYTNWLSLARLNEQGSTMVPLLPA